MQSIEFNPLGTDGFEFVEYTALSASGIQDLKQLFTMLGFALIAKHRHKAVWLYRQGDINFIINGETCGQAKQFATQHGSSVNAMAFRVHDASVAMEYAISKGAKRMPYQSGPMELSIPAIEGIGGAYLYFVDRYHDNGSIYDIDFVYVDDIDRRLGEASVGLISIDHLTHNVYRGNMAKWAQFYEQIANFKEIRHFDIQGKMTGLLSQAMTSPCGKIRIPINESHDDKSQIAEYLKAYKGEGIQHIALSTNDIYATVRKLKQNGVSFMNTPDSYYELTEQRLPGHNEAIDQLKALRILIDGDASGLLLQIFTDTVIGPVFFEIIQRKGNQGFGEGNFKALFESIEQDQIKRGVLRPTDED
ncbi:4-hydroxyphenylpyruvate dioxygenase [Thaumasiovibrio sp. DFM-14]|uniref:4-hydroxyphenylpyruvate dioxygenase n=1 Tax=Thaumasiovibrio sp. DFM-14 TaxID=3384792 RepID=UPI00399F1A44